MRHIRYLRTQRLPPETWCELYPGSRKGRFPLHGKCSVFAVQGKSIEGPIGVNSSLAVAGGRGGGTLSTVGLSSTASSCLSNTHRVSRTLSLSLSHTHTNVKHAHSPLSLSLTHTHMHTYVSLSLSHALTRTLTSLSLSHTHTRTLTSLSLSHTHTHAHSRLSLTRPCRPLACPQPRPPACGWNQ